MSDIETMLGQVWNPDTRQFANEAWRCYNAGALRASITAVWTAVVVDLIAKVEQLADDNEPVALDLRKKIADAQRDGLRPGGVRAMQNIEGTLLDTALNLELVDAVDQRALERIREDRNLCVHPSLRPFSQPFEPVSEMARAHLAAALDILLMHPPTQGRKLIEVYQDFTCSDAFVANAAHIRTAFFDRLRSPLQRNLATIAAKHALLELDPSGRLDREEYARRSAAVLRAFATRDREIVRECVSKLRDRFRQATPAVQRRALSRLGDQDFFWDMLDEPLKGQLDSLVQFEKIPEPYDELPASSAALLSLVANASARAKLPALTSRYDELSNLHLAAVLAARPSAYFVPTAIRLLEQAGSFRFAERAGQILLEHAQYFSLDDLESALTAWSENDQCCFAAQMPQTAVALLGRTRHLGPNRLEHFAQFLERVVPKANDEYYEYPDLNNAIRDER